MQAHPRERHRVLAGQPGTQLVLVQTELLLGFPKHTLSPVALQLPLLRLPAYPGVWRRALARALAYTYGA